jgi:predicted Zn-ribbon and HTH transcriptional regulator
MGWTKEQIDAWKKEYALKTSDRKLAQGKKLVEVGQLKKTHDWAAQLSTNNFGASGMLMATHCKKCGLTISAFKILPSACPKVE